MSKIDQQYQELLHKVYYKGFEYEDPNRKGVIRKQIPYYNFEHDFEEGFPIIGLKQTYPKMAFNEMKAFMMGKTNLKDLEDLGVTFWRDDAYNFFKREAVGYGVDMEAFLSGVNKGYQYDSPSFKWGDLGKIYSYQIRNWDKKGFSDGIDQLNKVLERLKKEPNSTKNIITMWNPSDLDDCALSPCHTRFSFVVEKLNVTYVGHIIDFGKECFSEKNKVWESPKYGLRIQWNQDSVDTFLGLPINVMYYSFVCYVFAHYLGMKPLGIIGNLSNVHLYDNSFSAVEKILEFNYHDLEPVTIETDLPKEWYNLDDYLRQLDYKQNIKINNYKHLRRFDVPMLAYNK